MKRYLIVFVLCLAVCLPAVVHSADIKDDAYRNSNAPKIFTSDASNSVTNYIFENNIHNTAPTDPKPQGGGIYASNNQITVSSVSFSGNQAYYGGGMASENANINISSSVFSENNASDGLGGALRSYGGEIQISSTTFSENTANGGGAVSLQAITSLNLSKSNFLGNSAAVLGGGLFLTEAADGTQVNVSTVVFSNNRAGSGSGGGAFLAGTSGSENAMSAIFSNAVFSGNSAVNGLGGEYMRVVRI